MALSNDLVSQFAKMSKDNKKEDKETTVYGKIVISNNTKYVQIDGSDRLTPISSTTDALKDERVTVMIKNHQAIVNGNISSPAARTGTVQELDQKVVAQGNDITAINNSINAQGNDIAAINNSINAQNNTIDAQGNDINAQNNKITAINNDIQIYNSSFKIENGVVTGLKGIDDVEWITTKDLVSDHATIGNLNATYAKIEDLKTNYADINLANISTAAIETLDARYATINTLNGKYANIDFSNIGEAAIKKFYATSGIIKDLTIGDTTVTGKLVGVTVSGDLIEGNTIKADKLLIKGDDGLYYGMNVTALGEPVVKELSDEEQEALKNGIHGTNIIAKSVTADKINVTDLQAFNATIAGFNLTDSAIYSDVKSSVDNGTRGIYLDKDGQISFGDGISFVKFYKDTDDSYKLEISADNISFGAKKITVEDAIQDVSDDMDNAKKELSNATKLYYKCLVSESSGYIRTKERVAIEDYPDASLVEETLTTTGEQVYTATDSDNNTIYICEVDVTDDLDNHQKRLSVTEAAIQNLGDNLLFTVQDENGGTALRQTSTGWTFNLDNIKDAVENSDSRLNEVESSASNNAGNIKSMSEDVQKLSDKIEEQEAYITIYKEDEKPYLELGNASNFKIRITNDEIQFLEGTSKVAYINNQQLYIERATMKNELEIGDQSGFIWKKRSNGNMGLQWFNRTDDAIVDSGGGSGGSSETGSDNVTYARVTSSYDSSGNQIFTKTTETIPCDCLYDVQRIEDLTTTTGEVICTAKYSDGSNVTQIYVCECRESGGGDDDADGSSFEKAITISLNETVSVTTGTDTVYYKFTPSEDGTYVFESTGGTSSNDPIATLYNSSQTELITHDDISSGRDYNFKIEYVLNSGETYYIRPRLRTGTSSFNFSVVKDIPIYIIAFNANNGSSDGISMSGTQGESITIPDVNVSRTGYTFAGWSTSSTASTAMYQPGDTYVINGNMSFYAVWIEGVAEGTSFDTAISISLDEDVSVDISTSQPAKYYKFTPSEDGAYTFQSTGTQDSEIYVYSDVNGTNEIGHNDDYGLNRNFRLTETLYSGTTYYIKVELHTSGTGSFDFKVYVASTYTITYVSEVGTTNMPSNDTKESGASYSISSTIPIRGGYDFVGWTTSSTGTATTAEYNPGDTYNIDADLILYAIWTVHVDEGTSFDTAIDIYEGTSVSVYKEYANQAIYYKFTPSTSGEYTFQTSGATTTVDPDGVLFDSSQENIVSQNADSDGKNFKITTTLNAGASYYLRILFYSTSTETGSVTLTVTKSGSSSGGDEEADGSSFDKAISISLNETVSVSVTSSVRNKYYKFIPSTDGTYVFESNVGTSGIDPKIELYEASDTSNVYGSHDDINSSEDRNFKLSKELTAGQTYYAKIYCYNSTEGTFNFSVTKEGSSSGSSVVTLGGDGIVFYKVEYDSVNDRTVRTSEVIPASTISSFSKITYEYKKGTAEGVSDYGIGCFTYTGDRVYTAYNLDSNNYVQDEIYFCRVVTGKQVTYYKCTYTGSSIEDLTFTRTGEVYSNSIENVNKISGPITKEGSSNLTLTSELMTTTTGDIVYNDDAVQSFCEYRY